MEQFHHHHHAAAGSQGMQMGHMQMEAMGHDDNVQVVMHPSELDQGQVPAFLTKTFDIVSDPNTDHIISWAPNGLSFVIHDTTQFLSDVVPNHFKHNNLASFVRQLNIYGFQKVGNKHVCEFRHDMFRAKERHLLTQIKRKTPNKRSSSLHDGDDPSNPHKNEAILTELLQLKQRQDLLEMNLVQAMNTNDSLWNDLMQCKQQQREIQENLQKTLYFLMTVYGNDDDKVQHLPTPESLGVHPSQQQAQGGPAVPPPQQQQQGHDGLAAASQPMGGDQHAGGPLPPLP